MIYVGWVVDQVYLPKDNGVNHMALNPHHYIWKIPTYEPTPRIFEDEVKMCFGLNAFKRMEYCYKNYMWEAYRAWRRLV